MTEPPIGGTGPEPPPFPPPYYPPTGQFPPPGYPPQPGYPPPGYYGPDPAAPYGRHPFTGEPLSDKSKVLAGLLQLLGLVGILGIGRIYLGQTSLGVTQLVVGLLLTIVTCGFGVIVPVIWGIVDTVLIFTDRVRDAQGRPLRDGT